MSSIKYIVIKRGDIFFADLGNTIGSEQSGIRPVIVVQNDKGNKYSPTVIVAPLTSKKKKLAQPTHVEINGQFGLNGNSVVQLEQLRTIDLDRFVDYVGRADKNTMSLIDAALRVSLDL